MLVRSLSQQVTDACNTIADEVCDASGFVKIGRLLERFDASLQVRPMLVEGMLASAPVEDTNSGIGRRWVVLVDSETYGIRHEDIESETSDKPLAPRLRNTIAHELVHSLAFRPTEFGISLSASSKRDGSTDLVRLIEQETERLSPLLLFPRSALTAALKGRHGPLSVTDLVELRKVLAVSRYVLINRLCTIGDSEKSLLASWGLRNLAVGLGQWQTNGVAVTRKWPVFFNFDRNLLPQPLRKILRQDRLPADSVFPDPGFAMCGGIGEAVALSVAVGTDAHPDVEQLSVEVSIEHAPPVVGSEFLFAVRVPRSHEVASLVLPRSPLSRSEAQANGLTPGGSSIPN